ncbi:hypothetical protein HMPREF1487_07862 [Pseudomonas sp. HPB0071]|uniref:winged helix-turn-helix domain-containing protein n=1 Tax=unclassified Pseudomonas TaxID=196821 RepID=UPI0002CB1A83|nr:MULTISPECIES: crosslink repair DNA glycosylase YcaQ family protein [unclassified Pseudomonas]ENA29608.1 hypothetical protein HMPREF1487_07862 [Pseudomonas sp. HPB0071]
MSVPLSLSLKEARRLALTAQGFYGFKPRGEVRHRHIEALMKRLCILQIDSVNALVRSHYLPLFSRLGFYPRKLLDEMAWSLDKPHQLFECWGHEASLMPMEDYPLMRWRMERAAQGRGIYRELARVGREQRAVIEAVLQAVRERGVLGAGSLTTRVGKAGPWWDWSVEKKALEWLFAAGEVTVAGRRGFERLYDLPERVIPKAIREKPPLSEAEAQRELIRRSAAAMGVAAEKDLRDYYRLDPADAKVRIAELVESGELLMLTVEGWKKPAFSLGEPQQSLRARHVSALLSPFDSLIWERARTERLFNFRYRLELYTPAHKRVYGYYVLPFLFNEHLVARVDLRAERAHDRLAVHALHGEEGRLSEEASRSLATNLRQLANWLGLAEISLHGSAAVLKAPLAEVSGGPA